MIKIQYVGAKTDGERAFKAETGIEWFPGDVHPVKPEHAAMMLRHPDVFEAVEGTVSLAAAKSAGSGGPVDDADVDAEATAKEDAGKAADVPGTDPLAGMDDAAVRAFVKANNLKVKGYGVLKGENLRAKVTAALAAK